MSGELVLIVDGDPKEQRVLKVSLKNAGLQVHAESSAYDALELLEQPDNTIGVAVIELNLPQMSGFELCERIRENPALDSVGLIALTNSQELSTKLRAYEVGFDELLTKPVFIKEISTRVDLMLQRRARALVAEAEAKEISLMEKVVKSKECAGESGYVGRECDM